MQPNLFQGILPSNSDGVAVFENDGRPIWEIFVELCHTIESDDFACEFYVASNTTDLLFQWMVSDLRILALQEKITNNSFLVKHLVERALNIFEAPYQVGYRIEGEAALCCYSFILSPIKDIQAQYFIRKADIEAQQQHGWLFKVTKRCLYYRSSNSWVVEQYAPVKSPLASHTSNAGFHHPDPQSVAYLNSTPFEIVSDDDIIAA